MARLIACAAAVGLLTLGLAVAQPPAPARWQPPAVPAPAGPPDPAMARLRPHLNPEFPPWSGDQVFERAAEHLAAFAPSDRCRIRFIDLSDVPRGVLPAMTSALFFGVNSLSTSQKTARPQPVPNTDGRIYWVDLLWYNWTPEVWEKVSAEDPYFREPIVSSGSRALRFVKDSAGNAVVRGDWLLYYAFDTTQFLKSGQVRADDAFYYQFIYGGFATEKTVKKKVKEQTGTEAVEEDRVWPGGKDDEGKEFPAGYKYKAKVQRPVFREVEKEVTEKVFGAVPQTAAEFEATWKVDLKALKDFQIDRGAIIDEGRSQVSFQNRVLWRVPGFFLYWRTFDVLRTALGQDYVENLYPKEFDAGEHIIQDSKGAQFYLLTDGKGGRVEFGDPRAVRDDASGEKGIVLTAKSCVACHADGIIAFRHELPRLLRTGAKLNLLTPDLRERVEQFYLQPIDRLVKRDQDAHREFIADCNGLTGPENAEQFARARSWYAKPVDLPQAARELGVAVEALEYALAYGPGTPNDPKGVTKGRLGRLILDGVPVPRSVWERGGFQEAGLLLIEARKAGRIK